MRAKSHEVVLGLGFAAMLLAACSGEKRAETAAPRGPAPAATPVTPALPARPQGADAVDAALAEAKAFNSKALADLAGIEQAEQRIRTQAGRALEAARRGDGARVTASRADAEAAHKGLADGFEAFRVAAAEQTEALDAAMALCAPRVATPGTPAAPAAAVGLAAYEGCVALPAEQALLAQNVEALAGRYQVAETAYRTDRAKLEEAAATMALERIPAATNRR